MCDKEKTQCDFVFFFEMLRLCCNLYFSRNCVLCLFLWEFRHVVIVIARVVAHSSICIYFVTILKPQRGCERLRVCVSRSELPLVFITHSFYTLPLLISDTLIVVEIMLQTTGAAPCYTPARGAPSRPSKHTHAVRSLKTSPDGAIC